MNHLLHFFPTKPEAAFWCFYTTSVPGKWWMCRVHDGWKMMDVQGPPSSVTSQQGGTGWGWPMGTSPGWGVGQGPSHHHSIPPAHTGAPHKTPHPDPGRAQQLKKDLQVDSADHCDHRWHSSLSTANIYTKMKVHCSYYSAFLQKGVCCAQHTYFWMLFSVSKWLWLVNPIEKLLIHFYHKHTLPLKGDLSPSLLLLGTSQI